LLAEIRVPGVAVLADHHVMRLDGRARQLVFGVDDLGAAALWARQGLELVFPGGAFAEIDGAEELGEPGARRRERLAALLEEPRGPRRGRRGAPSPPAAAGAAACSGWHSRPCAAGSASRTPPCHRRTS